MSDAFPYEVTDGTFVVCGDPGSHRKPEAEYRQRYYPGRRRCRGCSCCTASGPPGGRVVVMATRDPEVEESSATDAVTAAGAARSASPWRQTSGDGSDRKRIRETSNVASHFPKNSEGDRRRNNLATTATSFRSVTGRSILITPVIQFCYNYFLFHLSLLLLYRSIFLLSV